MLARRLRTKRRAEENDGCVQSGRDDTDFGRVSLLTAAIEGDFVGHIGSGRTERVTDPKDTAEGKYKDLKETSSYSRVVRRTARRTNRIIFEKTHRYREHAVAWTITRFPYGIA